MAIRLGLPLWVVGDEGACYRLALGVLKVSAIDARYRGRAPVRVSRPGPREGTVQSIQHLLRRQDARGSGKSLGPRNVEAEAVLSTFTEGKARANARLQAQSERVNSQTRLNRAVRLGRLPNIVGDILLSSAAARMEHDFCVIGTHAIHACEAMAGVHCRMELPASGDVDLRYDPRRHLSIGTQKLDVGGLLGLLRQADPSFASLGDAPFRAVNDKRFMVDLVIPARDMRDASEVIFGQNDLVAVELPTGTGW